MRLIELRIDGFGKLNNVNIGFSEGANLIYGRNEAGKSTVHACLRAMLFGMTRAKGVAALTDTYSHYKPWFAKNYGAELRVEDGGHIYRITRDFLRDPVGCTVYDETAAEAVPYADRFVSGLVLGMSGETYDSTVSIGKLKGDADGNLSSELKKYIVNMDTTGSRALNCARARARLTEQKRILAEKLSPDAAKEYAVNCGVIRRLEKSIRENVAVTRTEPAAAKEAVINTAAAAAAVTAAEAEAREARERAAKAAEELASLETDMECLNAGIIRARETLRSHNVYSSGQVAGALAEFGEKEADYQKKTGRTAAAVFRILYIACFILAVLDILATCYAFGGSRKSTVVLGFICIGVVFLLIGIVFLILCIVSKRKFAAKTRTFGKVLERYTGFDEVTPERIDRVKGKLGDLYRTAQEAESQEAKLAELSEKAAELRAAAQSAAAAGKAAEAAALQAAAHASGSEGEKSAVSEAGNSGIADGSLANPQSDMVIVNESVSRINELKTRNIALKELLSKNDALNEEMDAIDLAMEKIDEISDTMKDSLGVHLNARASEYIKQITGGAYDSLSVDDDLNVFMNTEERMVPIEQLSNGTSDQIYMALRLAGARLVQNGEDRLPVIFDDSFVNYDDERLASTLTWLVGTYAGQTVIFTCQGREEELLKENGLTFNSVHL